MKAHGVVVAIPLGQSWTPTPSIGGVVNVGTIRCRPGPVQPVREWAGASSAAGAGWGGGVVVVKRHPVMGWAGRRTPGKDA